MQNVGGYAHKVTTSLSFDDTISKVTELLKTEGFGILTEIDVTATLKKKIDVDFKPYRILGACNPPFAHQTLEAENLIGVLLPCNVVVWDDGDERVVAAMDARIMGKVLDDQTVSTIAEQVNTKLENVLKQV